MVVTLADDTTTTLNVENGKGITSIAKTGTSGLVDTYTITYNDATTSTFTVTNGEKGDTGDSWYVWIRYAGSQPTQDSDMGTDPDNWMGIYSGTSSTAPVHYTDYDWFEIKGEKGDQGDPSSIVSQSVTYQEGTTPNIQPSGTWTTTIPAVAQGNYLWTKTEIEFNSGSPVQFFSVARMGVDGTGSVSSVNGQPPDGNGNVTVTATDIQTTDSTSVQSDLTGLKNTLNQLDSSASAIEDAIAYVQSGDTASRTYTAGQFVYLKNHATLPEGLYTVNANDSIPSGTSVTGHLTADANGGLNSIKNMFKWTEIKTGQAVAAGVSYTIPPDCTELLIRASCIVNNYLRVFQGTIIASSLSSSSQVIYLSGGYESSAYHSACIVTLSNTSIYFSTLDVNGTDCRGQATSTFTIYAR